MPQLFWVWIRKISAVAELSHKESILLCLLDLLLFVNSGLSDHLDNQSYVVFKNKKEISKSLCINSVCIFFTSNLDNGNIFLYGQNSETCVSVICHCRRGVVLNDNTTSSINDVDFRSMDISGNNSSVHQSQQYILFQVVRSAALPEKPEDEQAKQYLFEPQQHA